MDAPSIKLLRENRTSISQFVLTNKIYIFVYSDNSSSQTLRVFDRFAYRPAHIPSPFIERKWRLIPCFRFRPWFSGLGHGLSVRFSQGLNDLIINILVIDNFPFVEREKLSGVCIKGGCDLLTVLFLHTSMVES